MDGGNGRFQSLLLRFIELLLKLYPPRFRREFSAEILGVLSSRLRDAQLRGQGPSRALRETAGLVGSIIRERWHEFRLRTETADRAGARRRSSMRLRQTSRSFLRSLGGCLLLLAVLMVPLGYPLYALGSVLYGETKGPFKNWVQVVDLEGDGDLDMVVSHTRWEQVDESWAGIGMVINQGNGEFVLVNDPVAEDWPFLGNAAAAGDLDGDGDLDVLYQEFRIHAMLNQIDLPPGEPGKYRAGGGINPPPTYSAGYVDMGGTITMGDLNGDGRLDAFLAGCCYGLKAWEPGYQHVHTPSVSWVWINDGGGDNWVTGHILRMDFLDGRPIRQAALGDLDRDGDLDIFAAMGKPTMGTTDPLDNLVLLNDGAGALSPYDQPLGGTDSTSVALDDVNGDGLLDALVGTSLGAQLWINQGKEATSGQPMFLPTEQTFRAERTLSDYLGAAISTAADKLLGAYLPYGSVRTKAVFLADLDGDGDRDAVLARLWGAEIWRNEGQGEFSRLPGRLEYPENTGVAVADFDGDGDPDIFAGADETNPQIWWNDGSGKFR